jgi:polar amino acid transport system substrate-binding protein
VRRAPARLAALGLLAALLAGCAGTSSRVSRASLQALATPLAGTPAPAAQPPPAPGGCANRLASIAPPATMPAPGHMPAGSFMASVARRGRLIAGVDQNTFLFGYFNPTDGQIEGFEIDLLRRVAQAIFGDPTRILFRAVTPAQRLAAVQSGSVDLVADAVTITCARRLQVDFSTVYYNASQRVLVPRNSPARSIHDFGGKRVCATIGSTSIVNVEHSRPRPIAYPVPQRIDCLVALQQGKVDAISTDDSILLGFVAQDPNVKLIGPAFSPQPYGMAISRAHPDFVAFVNGVLAELRANGIWSRIYTHWLARYTAGVAPAPPVAVYGG